MSDMVHRAAHGVILGRFEDRDDHPAHVVGEPPLRSAAMPRHG
jgi:hypothetical protein